MLLIRDDCLGNCLCLICNISTNPISITRTQQLDYKSSSSDQVWLSNCAPKGLPQTVDDELCNCVIQMCLLEEKQCGLINKHGPNPLLDYLITCSCNQSGFTKDLGSFMVFSHSNPDLCRSTRLPHLTQQRYLNTFDFALECNFRQEKKKKKSLFIPKIYEIGILERSSCDEN